MLKAGDKVLTYLGFLSDRPRVEAQVTLSRRNTEEPAAAWAVAHGMEYWWVRFEGNEDEFARYINGKERVMDKRIAVLPGFAEGGSAYSCPTCGNKMHTRDTSFMARLKGKRLQDYCSMACARKALGVEEEGATTCAFVACVLCCASGKCVDLRKRGAYNSAFGRPDCANYKPEAKPDEPFKHTICSGLAAEPEDEAAVWTWEDEDGPGVGGIRAFQYLRSSVGGRHVLLHQANWHMTEGDKALIAAAPQTAKRLKAAEAENAKLRAANREALDQYVRLGTTWDTLRTKNAEARDALKAAQLHLVEAPQNQHGTRVARDRVISIIDAALGKEDA